MAEINDTKESKTTARTFKIGKLQIVVAFDQVLIPWFTGGINDVHVIRTAKSTLQ